MQQEQGCSTSQSTLCFEGTEQHEEPLSSYGTYTAEAPAQHPAELAAVEADFPTATPEQELCLSSSPIADKQEQAAPQATPVTPQTPLTHQLLQQQQQTAPLSAQLPLPHATQQHTAAFAEAKVHFKCCVCFSLDTLFHRI